MHHMASARTQVLSLYRRILRTGKNWGGPDEEKKYIWREATQQFRANKEISEPEIPIKLEEGERRLELGVHYQIPYPRMHHAPQFKYIPPPELEDPLEKKLSSRDSDVTQKLAAAAKRRQEKLAHRGQ